MNILDYWEAHDRTFLKNGQVPPPWATALGLVGETGELVEASMHLTTEEIRKEAGDVLWYIVGSAKSQGFSIETVFGPRVGRARVLWYDLHKHVDKYADIVKKQCWHERNMADEARTELEMCAKALEDFCLYFALSFEQIAQTNIDKLKARWPEGFVAGVKGADQ